MSYPSNLNARLKLTVSSPIQTFTEPVTVAEGKEWCEIPDADTTRDTLIATLIIAARQAAELRQGRDLVTKQYDWSADYIPTCIKTRENLSSVDLFQYTDSDGLAATLTEGTGFIKDTAKNIIIPPYGESWPSFTPYPSSAILVRYTVTPPAVDTQVLLGMRFLISQWYANRIPAEAAGATIQQYPFCLALLDHGKVEAV